MLMDARNIEIERAEEYKDSLDYETVIRNGREERHYIRVVENNRKVIHAKPHYGRGKRYRIDPKTGDSVLIEDRTPGRAREGR